MSPLDVLWHSFSFTREDNVQQYLLEGPTRHFLQLHTICEKHNEQNSYYYQTNRWRAYFSFYITKEANKQQENENGKIFLSICVRTFCVYNQIQKKVIAPKQVRHYIFAYYILCVCVGVYMLYYNIYRKWYDMPRVYTFENLPASISVSSCILYYYRQTITHTVYAMLSQFPARLRVMSQCWQNREN